MNTTPTIEIKNLNGKLNTSSFIHISPFKKVIPRETFFMVRDPETGEEFECLFVDRLKEYTLGELPDVFCLLSHDCIRQKMHREYFDQLPPETIMSINIFHKISAQ